MLRADEDGRMLFLHKEFLLYIFKCIFKYIFKYTPEVVQDSKINLKWIKYQNAGENCAFLQIEDTVRKDIPRYQNQQFTQALLIVVLKNFAKFTGMHLHRSFFSTCDLKLYWKGNADIYSFLWVLQLFLGTALLWKTSCDLVLKGEFYENGEPTFFIIIKIYREVDSSFKKKNQKKNQTLRRKVYIWEPFKESWHWT